jgi:STE24 endopeptidase
VNPVGWIILAAILLDLFLKFVADYLNLKSLSGDLPGEFRGVYDAERYCRSQQYLRVKTRFAWLTSLFDLLIFLAFWFGRGFPWLDQWVQSLNFGPVMSGLVFTGTLLFAKSVISLPFAIYDTFVIEQRFGFNQTTWPTFVKDLIKGLVLAVTLGGPLFAAVLWFFEYSGASAWWYCWILVTLYSFAMQYVAPAWIMPFFNRFTPLEPGELRSAILSYADSIKFPVKNIYLMDGSRRSSKSNAFFTGFGRTKRIVLFDTLIEQHTVSELVAVLAHEMGHYKKRHILMAMLLGILQTGIMLYLLSLFISYPGLFDAFFMQRPSVYAGVIFFAMLYSPLSFFMSVGMQMISRRNEIEADRFAARSTGDARSLAEALKKLSANNLSNLTPHPLYVFLNYSHPPVLERLHRLALCGRRP